MVYDFLTLDDVDVYGKTVFLRVDINSPLDPSSKRILDDSRIKAAVETLKSLKEAKVVLGAHQSRPGRYDFTSLELHTRVLQMYHNSKITFVDDVIGEKAQSAIKSLKVGEVLVLDNLRKIDEENESKPPEELVKTSLVRTLAPFFDLMVNDAFAAGHRSQPSLVGFGELMPMVAGRLMQRELEALNRVTENPERPNIFVLGGVKIEDRLPVMRRVLKDGIADKILLGGAIHEVFQIARGFMQKRLNTLKDEEKAHLEEAKKLLETYDEKIELPVDVALDVKGERVEISIEKITDETDIYDIGLNTIARYCDQVKNAGTIVAEGPLGMFERRGFDSGTKELLRAMAYSNGFTLVGGGHLGSMASMMDLESRMRHVSTGGGAMLTLLAGESMPVIEALERSKRKYCY
ncbi:phosphoglycerate kinase [Candidatus Bathyarchaeota archaeon]|nr:phosphoglycerate kinase [Candidatus Bathyarchaeota archaeon]MBS7630042.1 phosphoglycerate kinase [Candidatus Bathyarchaeota archaeon]